MTNDIESRFSCLGITKDNNNNNNNDRPGSMIALRSRGDVATPASREEKELRRISLPTDPYRRSKFASWVQHTLPTPPSSRNNSRSSRSSSARSSTSSLSTISSSTGSPTSSPTSYNAPPLPITTAPIPTRSVSTTSTITTTTAASQTISVPPRSTSLSHPKDDEPLVNHRHAPLRSISEPNQQVKKKRFLPLVSRIRLGPGEKTAKKPAMDPPEPPPQLLMSALHCNNSITMDDHQDQRKSLSQNDLEQVGDTPSWLDLQQQKSTFPSLPPSALRMRRRSSCPPRPSDTTTTIEESVMMRSFASPTPPSSPAPSLTSPEHDVYDNNHCLLSFSAMKPRTRPLRRRTSGKREKKAFRTWHDSLVDSLAKHKDEGTSPPLSNEKRERNALTRKFILREFYLTEVTFWNQLYYSKVMFGDPLQLSLDRHSTFTRPTDLDIFSNLPDLMQCSSQLIRAMNAYLDHPPPIDHPSPKFDHPPHIFHHQHPPLPLHMNDEARRLPSPNDHLMLGKEICAMANHFVAFLRCAVDYKYNRKKLDQRSQHNKGFAMYQEKLALRKETNQFHVHDYLIIPIQRVARYGLLLADLQKHTDRSHPDYHHIHRARMILTSLAVAMNKAQL